LTTPRHLRNLRQLLHRARHLHHDLAQQGVIENPAARAVVLHGTAFAPRGQSARQPRARRVQVAQPLDTQPRVVGLDRECAGVLERGELFGEPLEAPEPPELLVQLFGERQQVAYVIERVFDLRGR